MDDDMGSKIKEKSKTQMPTFVFMLRRLGLIVQSPLIRPQRVGHLYNMKSRMQQQKINFPSQTLKAQPHILVLNFHQLSRSIKFGGNVRDYQMSYLHHCSLQKIAYDLGDLA